MGSGTTALEITDTQDTARRVWTGVPGVVRLTTGATRWSEGGTIVHPGAMESTLYNNEEEKPQLPRLIEHCIQNPNKFPFSDYDKLQNFSD